MRNFRIKTRHLSGLFAGLLCTLALFFGGVNAANAHDVLIDRTPKAETNIATAPKEVVLTYNNKPINVGAVVLVVDAHGKEWQTGKPQVSGFNVTQPLQQNLPAGHYQVRWRVVSSDGHPITGNYKFSVGDITNAAPIPASQDDAVPAAPAENRDTQATPEVKAGDSGTFWMWTGAILLPLCGFGAVVYVLAKRKKQLQK
ncbi:MAG: copper resistance protein CopC [Microbacteriaceae bacterium]|nr:copper resistance protein CopC [Microbacteriaceae bacterium]